ncbi:GTP-binding protein Era [Actinomycetales bacterium JB111]|nr:GTP-binding protein Era [Actinomycetales bacterium JB111]
MGEPTTPDGGFPAFPGEAGSGVELDEDTNALAGVDLGHLVEDWPEDFRAGFAALVGRPNTGKSTLTNALVGEKIAITSDRPQTTRRAVRGIVHRPDGQIVLVDTPGMHRPRTLLGERLNDVVRETLSGVDVIALCLPADEKIGPGDRHLLTEVADMRGDLVAIVTKTDKVSRKTLAEKLLSVSQLADFAEIVPVSSVKGEQIDVLSDVLLARMPLSPPLYPTGANTDESVEVTIAELVREAALEGVRDELPHSLAVVVDEMVERDRADGDTRPPVLAIHVSVVVERDSQKAIVIGRGGSRLREVGTRARAGIEEKLGRKVFLDLHVRVAKDWQRDPRQLGRLGF